MTKLPVNKVSWRSCWRVIPTRYMEKRILGKLAEDVDDLNVLEQLDAMTNERLRQERGELSFILPEDRGAPACSNPFIMAAFAYKNVEEGSRFSDGSYGVYYAADTLTTAIEETRYHAEVFMKRTKEGPMRLERRAVTASLDGRLHDIRGMGRKLSGVYSATSYSASQALGRELVNERSFGVIYDSVRHKNGTCVAVFRPPVLDDCRLDGDFLYEWDGARIAKIRRVEDFQGK